MKKFLSIDEVLVDLRSSIRWDLRFIKDYQTFIKTNHEFENIHATFSYNQLLEEKAANVEDWDTFKNYVASDFLKLKYPPCHLYVERAEVTAIWFVPDVLLINELGTEEKQIIMKNIEKQLMELKLCKLEDIFASAGDRTVEEDLFFDFYRKKLFLDALLSSDQENKANYAEGES
ncbi:hypothetical protein [Caldibacillus thermoamylovorans]|uniref:hypothetical protein n=1 Tax=Caldibacillus thermoamylovorans TaxID=35841 RepID=UPI00203D26B3|nr:hypothetical protein [Caldibacillus thermoamylovorans]MCM3478951.1 hypothetical protein [Caldibacillus thermoamylovorans]